MAIRFQCTGCTQPIEVDAEWAGKAVVCPYCRRTITAPVDSTLGDVSQLPMASAIGPPVAVGSAPGGGAFLSGPPVPPAGAQRENWAAIIAMVLSAMTYLFCLGLLMTARAHSSELTEFIRGQGGAMSLEKAMEWARRGEPIQGWMATLAGFECGAGLCWLTAMVCGIIGVLKPRRQRLAVGALVLCGLAPILVCGGLTVL